MLSKDKTPAPVKKTGKVMKMPAAAAKKAAPKPKRPPAVKPPSAGRVSPPDRRAAINRNEALHRVTLIFFIFVFIYILQGIITFAVKPHIAIDRIAPGSVASPVNLPGVIIRDEKVYTSPADGSVRFIAAENERVKKGGVVCDIENAAEVSRINAALADVNKQLMNVQSLRADADVSENERRTSLLIKSTLDDWPGRMDINDFSLVYALKDSLSANVDARNQIILSDSSSALKNQIDLRQMYQDELSKNTTPVTSEVSGVVSTLIDKLEDTYTLSVTAMLQKEQTTQKGVPAKPLKAQTAAKGDPLFKIVQSNIWYVASYLPNNLIKGWNANDLKMIYIENFPGLPVTVDHITAAKGNESYVLFKCTRFMEDFLASRYIHFEIGNDISEGLKIPQSAVITKTLLCVPIAFVSIDDDQMKRAKVTNANGDKISFTYVAADGGMVYVDPANGVVTSGMEVQSAADPQTTLKLTETMDVTGVYRVNNGAADFRKIVLDAGKTQDEGYYIIDPNANKNLQENDSIVHDASKVNEGEIIF